MPDHLEFFQFTTVLRNLPVPSIQVPEKKMNWKFVQLRFHVLVVMRIFFFLMLLKQRYAIFVSSGWSKKYLRLHSLNRRHVFVTVLEAGRPQWRRRIFSSSWEPSSWLAEGCLLTVLAWWRKSFLLLIRTLILSSS